MPPSTVPTKLKSIAKQRMPYTIRATVFALLSAPIVDDDGETSERSRFVNTPAST